MQLNVVSRGPEAADASLGALPPIVLLHGLFGRSRNLGFFQRRLAVSRRTLAIDLRNHGDSPHGPMDYVRMASDLLETLEAHDALPATLVGHSMGAKAAMMLALTRPEAVASLLVADIPPARTGHGSFAVGEAMLKIVFPPTLDRAGAEALLAAVVDDAAIRSMMMMNLRLGEDPGWTIGLEEIVASMNDIEGWPEIADGRCYDGPTLFVAGERSPYIRAEHHDEMRRLFPRYRLALVERAGHWLHVENPDRFLQLLVEFIRPD